LLGQDPGDATAEIARSTHDENHPDHPSDSSLDAMYVAASSGHRDNSRLWSLAAVRRAPMKVPERAQRRVKSGIITGSFE
jgi:hypothetical protein